MLKENEFMIKGSTSNKEDFKTNISFQVYTMDGDCFEHDIPVSCAEDIGEVFRLFHIKDWKTLFNEWDSPRVWYRDVTDVSFEGIYIVAKEENKGHVYLRVDNSPKVTVAVDLESMGDKSAAKIKEIRSILNK